jgi:hypothetical protein
MHRRIGRKVLTLVAVGWQILVSDVGSCHPFLIGGHMKPTHLYSEDGGTVFPRNVYVRLPGYVVSYHR